MLQVVVDLLPVLLLCSAGVALGRWTRWGGRLGAPLLVLLLSLALAGSPLTPGVRASEWISGPLTSLAVAVLLLPLDLRRLVPQARALLGPFLLALALVAAASVAAGVALAAPLGAEHAAIAGVMAAGYTGGTVNVVAVGESLALSAPQMALVMAAGHGIAILWFVLALAAGHALAPQSAAPLLSAETDPQEKPGLRGSGVTLLLALGVLALAGALNQAVAPLLVPPLLAVTAVALLIAQLPVVARQRLDAQLGMTLLLPFFSVVGLSTPWRNLLPAGGWLLLLAAVIAVSQGVGLGLLGRWQGIPTPVLLVVSLAGIGGPALAVMMATTLGRRELILPGLALGMLGYLVGTAIGLVVAWAVGVLV